MNGLGVETSCHTRFFVSTRVPSLEHLFPLLPRYASMALMAGDSDCLRARCVCGLPRHLLGRDSSGTVVRCDERADAQELVCIIVDIHPRGIPHPEEWIREVPHNWIHRFRRIRVALFCAISPMWSLATGNQNLMTAFCRLVPGEQELTIDREPQWLTEEDRRLILSSGLRDQLECFRSGGSNSTDWPRAKAFVIFTTALSETVRLPQPKHTTILYVPRGEEFVALPEDAETFERAIEFCKDQSGWSYWIEQASGAKSAGGLSL